MRNLIYLALCVILLFGGTWLMFESDILVLRLIGVPIGLGSVIGINVSYVNWITDS